MNKYCVKCGAELKEGVKFCEKCGNLVSDEKKENINTSAGSSNLSMVTNRNIGLAIVLSIVTCGIYGLVWMVSINDDINNISDDVNGTSGVMVLLFSILTCGIYTIYWYYKMGQKLFEAGKKHDMNISDNSIVYLVLSLVGLGIVNYCLMQNDLNKFS